MAISLSLTLLILCIARSALSRDWIVLSDFNPDEQSRISQECHDVDPGQCCVPLDLYALNTGQVWQFRPQRAYFYQPVAQGRQFNVFERSRNCAGQPAESKPNAPETWQSRGSYDHISGATMGRMAATRLKFPDYIALGFGDYTLEQQGPIIARYVRSLGEGPPSLMARMVPSLGESLLRTLLHASSLLFHLLPYGIQTLTWIVEMSQNLTLPINATNITTAGNQAVETA